MQQLRIVVVDDHPFFRQGVVGALSLEPDFIIIGEAADGNEALALIQSEQPDIAVLDVNLPGINGQQLTRQITNQRLPTRVVLVTAYDDQEQILHAMRAGASAYCPKEVKPEVLANVIRKVYGGKYVIGERELDQAQLDNWLDQQIEGTQRSYSDPGEPFYPLSDREMEVLVFVTQGLSNKEIAAILGISHQTVKNHVTAILRKLGVDDRTQAAVYALRMGWVRLEKDNLGFEE
jgi:DNA-binding NarL/FixJ family response regulator